MCVCVVTGPLLLSCQIAAAAALFLAAKVEEQPRNLEQVVKVSYAFQNRDAPNIDTQSEVREGGREGGGEGGRRERGGEGGREERVGRGGREERERGGEGKEGGEGGEEREGGYSELLERLVSKPTTMRPSQ